jgi:ATP-dependent Zn protease
VEKQGIGIRSGTPLTSPSGWADLASVIMFISMIMLVMVGLHLVMTEMAQKKNFGSSHRDLSVKMADIIGYAEVKTELFEIMDRMKNVEKYAAQGVRASRGLLLLGDPGVGKTMMAKAMANELGAEFFYCTGAEFAEMYVGVGPARVRELFKQARQHPMSFIFIDEIDAIGSRSNLGGGRADSERQKPHQPAPGRNGRREQQRQSHCRGRHQLSPAARPRPAPSGPAGQGNPHSPARHAHAPAASWSSISRA